MLDRVIQTQTCTLAKGIMHRLRTIGFILTVWLIIGLAFPTTASMSDGTLRFEVSLDGRPIGEHILTFVKQPNGLLNVAIDIDLDVKLGPFTVFTYDHRNRTAWRDGRLVALDSETDDNGQRHWVRAAANANGLAISSDKGMSAEVSAGLLPTTYWMFSTVRQNRLINSQTGEMLDVAVRRVGREKLDGPDGAIAATLYRMDGDLKINLWYDDSGVLVGLAFVARGAQVTYRLTQRSGPIPVSMAGNIMNARH